MSTDASKKETQVIAIPYSVANTSSGEECLRFDKLYVIVKASEFSENQSSLDGSLSQKLSNIKLFNQHASEGCFVDNLGNFTSNKTSALLSKEVAEEVIKDILKKDESTADAIIKTNAVFRVNLPTHSLKYFLKIWGYGDKSGELYGPFDRTVEVENPQNSTTSAYEHIEITNLRRFSQEHKNEILNPDPTSDTSDLPINTLQFSYFVSLPESEKIYFQELPKRVISVSRKDKDGNFNPGLFLYGEDLITLYRQPEEEDFSRYLDIFSIPSVFFSQATQSQLISDTVLTNDRDFTNYSYFNPFGESSDLKYILTNKFSLEGLIEDQKFELAISSYDPTVLSPTLTPPLTPSQKENVLRNSLKNAAVIEFEINTNTNSLIFISGKTQATTLVDFKRAADNSGLTLEEGTEETGKKYSPLALSCRLNSYKDNDSEMTFTIADTEAYLNETFEQENFEFIYLNSIPDKEPCVICVKNGNAITPIATYNLERKEWYGLNDEYNYFIKYKLANDENHKYKIEDFDFSSWEEDSLQELSLIIETSEGDKEKPLLLQEDNPNVFFFVNSFTLEDGREFVVAQKEGDIYKDIEDQSDYDLDLGIINENTDQGTEQKIISIEYQKIKSVESETQYSEGFRKPVRNQLEKLEGLVIFFSQKKFSLSKKEIQSFRKLGKNGKISNEYSYFYQKRSPELWPVANIKVNGEPTRQVKEKDILCRYYLQDFSLMNFENNSLTITLEEAKSWRKMYAIVAVFDDNAMQSNFENGVPYLVEYPMYTHIAVSLRFSSIKSWTRNYKKIRLSYIKNNKLKHFNKQDLEAKNDSLLLSDINKSLREQENSLLLENENEDDPEKFNRILYFYIPTIISEQSLNFCTPVAQENDYEKTGEKILYFRFKFKDSEFRKDTTTKEEYPKGKYFIEVGQTTSFGPQRLVFDVTMEGNDDDGYYAKITPDNENSEGILSAEDMNGNFDIINLEDNEIKIEDIPRDLENITMELVPEDYEEKKFNAQYIEAINEKGSADKPLQSFEVQVNYNENE